MYAKNKTRFFLAFGATAIFYALWWNSALLTMVDSKIYDLLSVSKTKPPRSQATVIVQIDERSLEALGQWPWPRVVMAQLFEKIAAMNPAATAVDVMFSEPDRTSPSELGVFYTHFFHLDPHLTGLPDTLRDNDRLLANTIAKMNFILPVFFDPSGSVQKSYLLPTALNVTPNEKIDSFYNSPYLISSLPILQHSAHGCGHIQASADQDGIFRRLPLFIRYNDKLIPTLGLSTMSTLDSNMKLTFDHYGRGISVDVLGHTIRGDEHSQVLLHFYPPQWYKSISAVDVLRGEVDPSLFAGKYVFVGASAMGLHDNYMLNDGTIRPGITAHATLIENILDNTLVSESALYQRIAFAFSLLSAIALLILMRAKKYIHVLALYSLLIISALIFSVIMLRQNLYISTGYFMVPLTFYLFILAMVLFIVYYSDQKRFYEKMAKANEAMIDSMALVAETRDIETGAHIMRTKEYIRQLAEHLESKGLYRDILTQEYIIDLYHAAPLHDVGKVGIPDNILKKKGKLTNDEFEVMKTHAYLGKRIVENAMRQYQQNEIMMIAQNIAHFHHEKWDGSGYPNGLKEDEIPLEARLMALADVYDALISRRVYKEAFSYEESENIIIEGRGTHFDPILVDAFIEIKDQYKIIAEEINEGALH